MKITTPRTRRIQDRVEIPPLTDTDRAGLAEEFSHLSAETRWRRFSGTGSRLTERDLDRLANIEHHDHEALAAIAPDTGYIVGVARYIALPNVSEILDRARGEGIVRLGAYLSSDNYPVREWIARSAGIVQANIGDATVYSIPLEDFDEDRMAA